MRGSLRLIAPGGRDPPSFLLCVFFQLPDELFFFQREYALRSFVRFICFLRLGLIHLLLHEISELLDLFLEIGDEIIRPFFKEDDKGKRREQKNHDPEYFAEQGHLAGYLRFLFPAVNRDCTDRKMLATLFELRG